jgi:death-on-curing protein
MSSFNGARISASADETETYLLGLYAAGSFGFAPLNRWLRENVTIDSKA